MFILMVVIFVLGYTAIALEHPIKVDKAASALLTDDAIGVVKIISQNTVKLRLMLHLFYLIITPELLSLLAPVADDKQLISFRHLRTPKKANTVASL